MDLNKPVLYLLQLILVNLSVVGLANVMCMLLKANSIGTIDIYPSMHENYKHEHHDYKLAVATNNL